VALRTADEEASSEVLGSPDAAFFDPAIRGRAIAKTGPRRLVPFQTAYAGGWTTNEPPPPQITIEELAFGARKLWEPPDIPQARRDLGDKDIVRMIRQIRAASVSARLPLPAQPWKQPLAPVYDLSVLPRTRNDGQIVFGVQDLPKQQVQPVIAYHPDEDGNLAVFGTAGSGKSTMLRSIAISAGPSGRCWVYGLDFGNRGLSMLEGLPHVGAIVGAADDDRIRRLVKWLALEVDRRATRYSKAGAGSLAEYRGRPEYGAEPRILLLVDAFQAFQKAYETADRTQTLDLFQQIVSGGTQFGVHVVLTADRPASVPLALASSIPTRMALRLADPSDYSYLGMPSDVITHTSPPGRGMLLGTELQVAVLGMPGSAGRPIRVDSRHQAEAAAEFAITLRHPRGQAHPRYARTGAPGPARRHRWRSAGAGNGGRDARGGHLRAARRVPHLRSVGLGPHRHTAVPGERVAAVEQGDPTHPVLSHRAERPGRT
jgi:S-DNA-T family DNA segregation ATPase FtsK/SpoIIIE